LATLALTGCARSTASQPVTAHPAARSGPSLAVGHAGALSLTGGWVAAATTTMSAAYLTVHNSGARRDRLVSASTPVAAETQLHTTMPVSGGSAETMMRVQSAPVPAAGTLTLAPGGYHLMLMGLRHPLVRGAQVQISLSFASGRSVTASFPVIDRAAAPAADRRH
jgi:copper(I)-binding protein